MILSAEFSRMSDEESRCAGFRGTFRCTQFDLLDFEFLGFFCIFFFWHFPNLHNIKIIIQSVFWNSLSYLVTILVIFWNFISLVGHGTSLLGITSESSSSYVNYIFKVPMSSYCLTTWIRKFQNYKLKSQFTL